MSLAERRIIASDCDRTSGHVDIGNAYRFTACYRQIAFDVYGTILGGGGKRHAFADDHGEIFNCRGLMLKRRHGNRQSQNTGA